MEYNFLILTFIFWIPGILIYVLRFDLRRIIHLMAAFSLPFALTEWLFYPEYWVDEGRERASLLLIVGCICGLYIFRDYD